MDVTASNVGLSRVTFPLGDDCAKKFLLFLQNFEENGKFRYKETVEQLKDVDRVSVHVSFQDIISFDEKLSDCLRLNFFRLYPYINEAMLKFVNEILPDTLNNGRNYSCTLLDFGSLTKLRELKSMAKGTLLKTSGQVIRSHTVNPELKVGTFKCSDCGATIKNIKQNFVYTPPTICLNPQCHNRKSFQLLKMGSTFADFQKVIIQEIQEEIPKGSTPRSIEVILHNDLVETAFPGDICEFTGTLILIPDVSQIQLPGTSQVGNRPVHSAQGYDSSGIMGLRELGARQLSYRFGFLSNHVKNVNNQFLKADDLLEEGVLTYEALKKSMNENEISTIYRMSQDPNLMQNLADSLFPNIYGNDEVKQGILLMLFGGVPKVTEEKTKLRGDINICVIGDPSTGKSQFLKRINEFSDRSVYTSGKASTAAGLTAAVVRDAESNEFVIEAGALMLANNGICCIDEFDKMELHDQVAIHEAMEQQTISITKAGVKASLSARASVLAAANPIMGRYDRSRTLRQNINLTGPLLSRFDLFFILLDECSEDADKAVALRMLQVSIDKSSVVVPYTEEEVRRYVRFARCFEPRLTKEAMLELEREYKLLREGNASGSGWRITVRQLESTIRLSEAIARMHFSDHVTVRHTAEAVRLISRSIVRVTRPDVDLVNPDQPQTEVQITEEESATPVSASVTLSFDEYQTVCRQLIYQMRLFERERTTSGQEQTEDAEEGSTVQMRRTQLLDCYLESIIDEIVDEDDYFRRKKIIDRVITRMIEKDGILMAITRMELDGEETNDPFLSIHPNVPDE